jgi:hypothetical protein
MGVDSGGPGPLLIRQRGGILAKVIESEDKLTLQLSFWEKVGALHNNLIVDKSSMIEKVVVENPWQASVLKGIRAPGTGFPYLILLGTMRYRGGKDFTAIYKRRPVEIYTFKAGPFKRWIVTK